MSHDISHILRQWPFQADDMTARVIHADDGRQLLQLRIDLGVLQMEMDGRPDGVQPEGFPSWLDYYEAQQTKHDELNPDGPPYLLGAEDCGLLWREGVQYYHRYLGLWHLGLFEECARDTKRNLRLFDFVRDHASEQPVKLHFEQWRPYVLMMNTRARAMPVLKQDQFAEGLKIIESGIDAIQEFLDQYGQGHRAEECLELASLEQWREEIIEQEQEAAQSRPASAEQILRRKLQAAIEAEDFEQAARLRDELRQMQHKR